MVRGAVYPPEWHKNRNGKLITEAHRRTHNRYRSEIPYAWPPTPCAAGGVKRKSASWIAMRYPSSAVEVEVRTKGHSWRMPEACWRRTNKRDGRTDDDSSATVVGRCWVEMLLLCVRPCARKALLVSERKGLAMNWSAFLYTFSEMTVYGSCWIRAPNGNEALWLIGKLIQQKSNYEID